MLYRKDPFIKNNHKTEHETEGIKKMLLNELVMKIAMQDCGQACHSIIKGEMPLLCGNINNASTKSRVWCAS